MSPPASHLPRRNRGRRRRLATPFVITAALAAPGCKSQSGDPERPPPGNPPVPEQPADPADAASAAPEPTAATSDAGAGAAKLPEPPESGGHLYARKDGTCWWIQDVSCPEGAQCNPPPPERVQCPDEDGEGE